MSEKDRKNEHSEKDNHDDGCGSDGEAGDEAPEEQQSRQVESVSLTPQHSAAKPRRVMYDLERRIVMTQAANLTPMRMRRTRR